MSPLFFYLHGFLSSPLSRKAGLTAAFLREQHADIELQTPALPEEPALALAAAEAALAPALAAGRPVGLIGSSMGGFYATVLAQRHGLRAVLVNPSVLPHRRIAALFGEQVNPYSGRRFILHQGHAEELRDMAPAAIDPGRYWLLVQTGDEVLDYREAVAYYAGSRQTVEEGGDHLFQGFERHLPAVVKFLQCGPAAP